jgi:hypothetical protein
VIGVGVKDATGVGGPGGNSKPNTAKACPSGSSNVMPRICTRTGTSGRCSKGTGTSRNVTPPLISNEKTNGGGLDAPVLGETAASITN